jgi:hypothetical protein
LWTKAVMLAREPEKTRRHSAPESSEQQAEGNRDAARREIRGNDL